jgi:DNA replication protein DnaD
MHCHLIVSRKDQSNKVKISPLTNHRNTKKGAIKGGFDRVTLFENVEKGFDKLFGYNRQLTETFEYCNTMKNGTVMDKLRMQKQEINTTAQQQISTSVNQSTNHSVSQSSYSDGLSSLFSILPSGTDIGYTDEQQPKPQKKKKKRRPRLS